MSGEKINERDEKEELISENRDKISWVMNSSSLSAKVLVTLKSLEQTYSKKAEWRAKNRRQKQKDSGKQYDFCSQHPFLKATSGTRAIINSLLTSMWV